MAEGRSSAIPVLPSLSLATVLSSFAKESSASTYMQSSSVASASFTFELRMLACRKV